MSSSDAPSQDSPKHSTTNTPFEIQSFPLHLELAFDPALLLPPSEKYQQKQQEQEQQQSENIPPQASSDEEPIHLPLVYPDDTDTSLVIRGDILEIDEDDGDDISAEDLALVCHTRKSNRGPTPGSTRVLKKVRVRKQESSNKRRSKKQTLRVQLQKQDRIEEEMAQFRGKGKVKEPSKPGRRYLPNDSASGSRPPSSLRFSETCHYEKDLGDMEDDDLVTLSDLDASMEYGPHILMDRAPSPVA